MFQKAQLLQFLRLLQRRRCQLRITLQRSDAVSINADMAQIRKRAGNAVGIAHIRNRRAAEIQRQPALVADHLDRGRRCRRMLRVKRCGKGRHRRLRSRRQRRRHFANQRGRQQRLIALHIDDDGVIRPAKTLHHLAQPLGAVLVVGAGQNPLHRRLTFQQCVNARVIKGDPYRKTAGDRLPRGAHDHRHSGNQPQRFGGQTGRTITGGNDDDGVHDKSSG